jgi:biotin carboxyl carrier protein
MDLGRIEALIEVVEDAAVTELTVSSDGSTVSVKKPPRSAAVSAPVPKKRAEKRPSEPVKPQPAPEEPGVHAPMVGIFHSIDGVGTGSQVKPGQVIGAIESMKLMNEVRSELDGTLAEALVEDGMPVEYGQLLFRLDKA